MTADIALAWDNSLLRADLAMSGSDIAIDKGLQTAITVSLLTDRQALPGDVLPDRGVRAAGGVIQRSAPASGCFAARC